MIQVIKGHFVNELSLKHITKYIYYEIYDLIVIRPDRIELQKGNKSRHFYYHNRQYND